MLKQYGWPAVAVGALFALESALDIIDTLLGWL